MIRTLSGLCLAASILLVLNVGSPAQSYRSTSDRIAERKADLYLRKVMEDSHMPGASLAVLREGKIVTLKNYGFADLEHSIPVTGRSVFQICSITKPFTAMGVMLLWQDGKLSIDDPIIKYLPHFSSSAKDVTIRQLLSHTSGIRDYDLRPETEGEKCVDNTLPDLEKWFRTLDLISPPGEKWAYQNTGYALLGRLIQKVSGKSYGEFLKERIFDPLAMSDTRMLSYESVIARRAKGYAFENGKFVNGVHIDPEVEFASGGLVSTTTDLAKLDAALFTDKLLRATTLKEMWSHALFKDGSPVNSYGLGFGVTPYKGRSRVGHTGGCPGFATAYQRFSDDMISVILLTNGDQESGLIGSVSNEIAYLYLRK